VDGQTVAAILASSSIGTVVAVAIQGWNNRRKLGAEATQIITKAATDVIKEVREENAQLRADRAKDRADLEAVKVFIAAHRIWDIHAQSTIVRLGGSIEAPPAVPIEWTNLWAAGS